MLVSPIFIAPPADPAVRIDAPQPATAVAAPVTIGVTVCAILRPAKRDAAVTSPVGVVIRSADATDMTGEITA